MATEVTCIVDTDGTQNPDYTSLAAAIAGETGASPKCVTSANLVTNDEQLTIECRASSGAADNANANLNGFTVDSTRYVKIFVPAGHRHNGKWSTGKARLVSDATNDNTCLTVNDPYTIIDGLQIDVGTDRSYRYGIQVGETDVIVRNCIIRNSSSSTDIMGIRLYDADGGGFLIYNCIVYGFNTTNSFGINVATEQDGALIMCCTVSGCGTGIRSAYHDAIITNCASFNNATDISGDTITVSYCATDDGSGTNAVDISPGATEADDWAAAFTDYSNGDFSLKSGSDLIDAGIGPALDSNVPTTDIVGTSRSGNTCCIGAFEYVGGLKIPIAMHHYNLLRSA